MSYPTPPELPRERARRIVSDVARRHGLQPVDIYRPGRFRHICRARKEAINAVHEEFPKWSAPQLGNLFQRDWTTILHALGRTARARRLTAVKDAPISSV